MMKKIALLFSLGFFVGCASNETAPTAPSTSQQQARPKKSSAAAVSEEPTATTAPVAVPQKSAAELAKALDSNNQKELLAVAGSILAQNPYDAQALNALAIHHISRQEWGAAKLLLEKALEKNKNVAGLYNNLGVIALREDNLESAYAYFKTAYSVDAKNPNVLNNLGSVYVKYLDYAKAVRPIEDAYSYMSESPSVTNNYAIVKRVQGQYDEAAGLYMKILDKDSRNVSTMLNYAILLIEYMKKYDEGVKLLNKLEFLESNEPYVRNKITELNAKVMQAKK